MELAERKLERKNEETFLEYFPEGFLFNKFILRQTDYWIVK